MSALATPPTTPVPPDGTAIGVTRVLVVDDNVLLRTGVRSLLDGADGLEVVGDVGDGRAAVLACEALEPDVVVLDVDMPEMDGVAVAEAVAERHAVLMLTMDDRPPTVAAALRAGAAGYLVSGDFGPDDLVQAVRDVAAGRPVLGPRTVPAVMAAMRQEAPEPVEPTGEGLTSLAPDEHRLTDREVEVMDAIARGLDNEAIAEAAFISVKTVKNHVNHIFAKLGVASRGEAIATWLGTVSS